jgi:hypothetical protein
MTMKAKVGSDPHYLVQALADVKEGEELILEMKKAGVKSNIEVTVRGDRRAREDRCGRG